MSALGQGLLEGQQFGQQFNDARAAAHQRKLDEAARQSSASAIPGAPPPEAEKPGIVHKLKDIVVGFYDKLHHHTLNDAHAPNGDVTSALPEAPDTAPDGTPIPPQAQATTVAANAAATDPSANAGVPQEAPSKGKAHSMTSADDDELENHILAASRAAALAGEDPVKVYQNLSAIKTAHYQGNILKNLNAAGVALQRGDTKAVEQALKNVYYYFPDGQDLKLQHGENGQLLYQDPFAPTMDDGSPNMIPVDAAHIQMLGQAAVDSTKLQDTINASKNAAVERQTKLATAQAAIERGHAASREAAVKERLVPATIYHHLADAKLAEAKANTDSYRLRIALNAHGQMSKQQQTAANDAAAAAFALAQGLPTTVPVTDAQGNPSLSPAAGKTIRDATKVPAYLKGLTPEQTVNVAGVAGQIAAANIGTMSKEQAVELAARMEQNRTQTHEKLTGGQERNVKVSQDGNWAMLWSGVSGDGQDLGFKKFRVAPMLGQALLAGRSSVPTEDEANAEGGDPSLGGDDTDPGYDPSDPNDDPSYHVPAIPAQQ